MVKSITKSEKLIKTIDKPEKQVYYNNIPEKLINELPFRNCVPSELEPINMQKEGVIPLLLAPFLGLPVLNE